MSSGISFFAQDQNQWASAAAWDKQLSDMSTTAAKMFSGPPASTTSPTNVLAAATSTSNSVVNPIGLIARNFSMNSAVLAAQEGNDRVNTKTSQLNTSTTAPAGDLSSHFWGISSGIQQITFADGTTQLVGQIEGGPGAPLTFTWIGTVTDTTFAGSDSPSATAALGVPWPILTAVLKICGGVALVGLTPRKNEPGKATTVWGSL